MVFNISKYTYVPVFHSLDWHPSLENKTLKLPFLYCQLNAIHPANHSTQFLKFRNIEYL